MDRAIRNTVVLASVAGAVAFGYVLGLAPIDERRSPRAGALSNRPRLYPTIDRIREYLATGQHDRAVSLSAELVEHYEGSTWVMLEHAQALEMSGRQDAARQAWGRVLSAYESFEPRGETPERDRLTVSSRYEYARAMIGVGRVQEGREMMRALAQRAGEGTGGGAGSAALGSTALYNLACYHAIGGEPDRALARWSDALGAGLRMPDDWWRVDPDLATIREDPRFWEAAEAHGLEARSVVRGARTGSENADRDTERSP